MQTVSVSKDMRNATVKLYLLLPWIVLVLYGVLLVEYARYLDGHLIYVKPVIAAAPEDVIGFGFWPTWAAAFILLVGTSFLAFRNAIRRPAYFILLAGMFLLISMVDYFLYETLFRQLVS